MRRTPQIVLVIVATVLLVVFLALWYQTARTAPALAWAADLPANARVERGHLRVVKVSANREFPVLSDPGQVLGHYTTRPILSGGLVIPPDVAPSLPPGRHVFPNGAVLPRGTDGYGFPLGRPLAASLGAGDLVDVYLVVPGEEVMYLLLQKFPVLYRLEDPPVAALALEPEQVAVVEGMMSKALEQARQAEDGDESPPPYYLVLPTQGENPDRQPLAAFPFKPDDPAILAAPTPAP
jgi:hypothetical protein